MWFRQAPPAMGSASCIGSSLCQVIYTAHFSSPAASALTSKTAHSRLSDSLGSSPVSVDMHWLLDRRIQTESTSEKEVGVGEEGGGSKENARNSSVSWNRIYSTDT